METILIIGLIFGILWAFICYGMAKNRGRDKILGACLGFIFGLFAVIGYAIAGKTTKMFSKEVDDMMEAKERARKKVSEEKENEK